MPKIFCENMIERSSLLLPFFLLWCHNHLSFLHSHNCGKPTQAAKILFIASPNWKHVWQQKESSRRKLSKIIRLLIRRSAECIASHTSRRDPSRRQMRSWLYLSKSTMGQNTPSRLAEMCALSKFNCAECYAFHVQSIYAFRRSGIES